MAELMWSVNVRDIPDAGLSVAREATEEERAGLAEALGILAVEAAAFTGRIRPQRGGGYRLEGMLRARVVQACVVSLDPVEQIIEDKVEINLREGGDEGHAGDDFEATESLLDEPDVDTIENGVIALGRIVYEELVTRLDPFPRKEGEELDQSSAGESGPDNPFAALARLKDEAEKKRD